ncbi:MAG: M28 family peptidase [Phycisphaerales bacterium]
MLAVLGIALAFFVYFAMLRMPGTSFAGPSPPLTAAQRDAAARMQADVETLASGIGRRSTLHPRQMAEAARHIIRELEAAGFATHEEVFVERNARTPNIIVELLGHGTPEEIIVVGAHYDSYAGTPGADDNASGVAGCLELARRFAGSPRKRTIRFAFFVNEEPPSFQTPDMGSWVYAKACRARDDNVVAMLSLETIGYYTNEVGSQRYPPLISAAYPDRGDFIAIVGDFGARDLVRKVVGDFRSLASFPCEGAALPGFVPGVDWSDHWAFSTEGYPAVMVTDTAPFRNPHYHQPTDVPATLDFEAMARVIDGIAAVVRGLAGEFNPPARSP